MNKSKLPVVLTIAGSDSGGGAGIQADLKTFASLGVHGTSALTCVTAQNPKGVLGIQACKPEIVRQQIQAVFSELPPAAVKTGMLFSTEIIQAVVEFFQSEKRQPLIVDPVMISTSGARLLKPSAIRLLTTRLLPLATLVTPNLDEAKALLNRELNSVEDLRSAAKEIHERFGCAALVKGGHLRTSREAADIFFDGQTELLLTAPFIKGVSTHGTGCTYSAAIAGYLAAGKLRPTRASKFTHLHPPSLSSNPNGGEDVRRTGDEALMEKLPTAVALAKNYITQAIAQSVRAGKHSVLNSFWKQQR